MYRNMVLITCLVTMANAPTWAHPQADLSTRIDAALASATEYLIDAQSSDGAWRSPKYGCFRDGTALTPLVLSALFPLAERDDAAGSARHAGVSFLLDQVDSNGRIRTEGGEPTFPVYTAAAASWVVTMEATSPRHVRARDAWIEYLRARRLSRALGWRPEDPQFGGWGYAAFIPQKRGPDGGAGMAFESNLSATLFGLAALRFAGVPLDDPVYGEILTFVERCQNFADDPKRGDPDFDDGGFFFSTTDHARNKAGIAGPDRFGVTRMHSYGSATADGLRALRLCGLPGTHPRVVAARNWLVGNFAADTNPGNFAADREEIRDATYFYYCWSVAHAALKIGEAECPADRGPARWSELLATELIARQRPDGSWSNPFSDAKEDDPLIATPLAVAALAVCRCMLPDSEESVVIPTPAPPDRVARTVDSPPESRYTWLRGTRFGQIQDFQSAHEYCTGKIRRHRSGNHILGHRLP